MDFIYFRVVGRWYRFCAFRGEHLREPKLASKDRQEPSNGGWQHDLSVNYEKLGNVQWFQGNLALCLSSLEIRQRLAARDPSDVSWQTDLVISLWRLAAVLEQQGSPQKREAEAKYQLALEILRPLAVQNRLTAEQKPWISQIEARMQAITKARSRP